MLEGEKDPLDAARRRYGRRACEEIRRTQDRQLSRLIWALKAARTPESQYAAVKRFYTAARVVRQNTPKLLWWAYYRDINKCVSHLLEEYGVTAVETQQAS